MMSWYRIVNIALEIILRQTSPMPIGLTPGCLSRAIKREAVKADKPDGCTYEVQRWQAMEAIEEQKMGEDR